MQHMQKLMGLVFISSLLNIYTVYAADSGELDRYSAENTYPEDSTLPILKECFSESTGAKVGAALSGAALAYALYSESKAALGLAGVASAGLVKCLYDNWQTAKCIQLLKEHIRLAQAGQMVADEHIISYMDSLCFNREWRFPLNGPAIPSFYEVEFCDSTPNDLRRNGKSWGRSIYKEYEKKSLQETFFTHYGVDSNKEQLQKCASQLLRNRLDEGRYIAREDNDRISINDQLSEWAIPFEMLRRIIFTEKDKKRFKSIGHRFKGKDEDKASLNPLCSLNKFITTVSPLDNDIQLAKDNKPVSDDHVISYMDSLCFGCRPPDFDKKSERREMDATYFKCYVTEYYCVRLQWDFFDHTKLKCKFFTHYIKQNKDQIKSCAQRLLKEKRFDESLEAFKGQEVSSKERKRFFREWIIPLKMLEKVLLEQAETPFDLIECYCEKEVNGYGQTFSTSNFYDLEDMYRKIVGPGELPLGSNLKKPKSSSSNSGGQ